MDPSQFVYSKLIKKRSHSNSKAKLPSYKNIKHTQIELAIDDIYIYMYICISMERYMQRVGDSWRVDEHIDDDYNDTQTIA